MPVLLLLLLGTIEMAMRVYYKAQVRSAATAAALAAVGTQVHWPIPIPTEWVVVPPGVPIPVNGIVVNTLHLPNVDWRDVRGEALETKKLTNPNINFDTLVLPWPLAPSPFKWVRIKAKVSPPMAFSRIFQAGDIEESACAIAWIHPEYWEHGWWDKRSQKSLLGIGDKNYRYYRLVPCKGEGVLDALEAVTTAYLQDNPNAQSSEVIWDEHKFKRRIPEPHTGSDSPPPLDKCAAAKSNCSEPKAQSHICSTDNKTEIMIEPVHLRGEGEPGPRPTLAEIEAKQCPPPPPPDEKKEGSP